MSRARKGGDDGGDVTSPGVAALVNGNGPGATEAPPAVVASENVITTDDVKWFDPKDGEITQLRGDLNAARIAVADANRLMDQLKIQRNAALDEIMLLRAQLKVAIEDGNAGWAAASAASGQTH